MLESRAERSALGTAPDVAVVDVGLNFLSPKTYPLNHTSKKTNYPSTTAAQEACFDFARTIFIFATRPESEARNWIRIIISLTQGFRMVSGFSASERPFAVLRSWIFFGCPLGLDTTVKSQRGYSLGSFQ